MRFINMQTKRNVCGRSKIGVRLMGVQKDAIKQHGGINLCMGYSVQQFAQD